MKILVLGSAAGGGFPQWNCNCHNCAGVRAGDPRFRARTQSSIAISADGVHWALINASPDILAQLKQHPELQPARMLRDSGISAVILVDAQIDHTTGLFMLRERASQLPVWCTEPVHQDLTTGNPVFGVLQHFCGVDWHPLRADPPTPFSLPELPDLRFTPVALASQPPPFSPRRGRAHREDNIGLLVEDLRSSRKLFYAPGLGAIEPHLDEFLAQADCIMVDGTFWTDDEMIRLGLSRKTAREIGHLPQSGGDGMIARLSPYASARRILIHINNTNPILDSASHERRMLQNADIEVAFDGMKIEL
ncbi:pyrroloquinoline quinone biosynthesis protein PqqB [Cognatazoarcus halotolerans]|uniref:pyrroloquinoline quinone biosynthesis protein PqqB n=1 Tax=Cognatazoarcus halotolerans TaxID=2686016 RepID=UPI00135ABEBB|nr:pyrroloquinoline quinone biosynthesis protein PqqB [Cognatazoarcus halotolerans]MCB1900523.1 pyrroloquinoline quinone biosynthesis protein PqqB [Rhodocyclaceae bacterium]MCP5308729.1 pyrroloquinoline quinone biosynthesis protein PqqB [Zoogloeaceae bacterium]